MLSQDELYRWLAQAHGFNHVRRLGGRWVQVAVKSDVAMVDVYTIVLEQPLPVGRGNLTVAVNKPFLPEIRLVADSKLETGAYLDPEGRLWAPGGHNRERLLGAVRKVADAVADRIMIGARTWGVMPR